MSSKPNRIFIAVLVVAAVIFIISLCLWIVYPILFPILVAKNLALSEASNGLPSSSTFFWSKPPINADVKVYFFNVTNADEVVYEGAKPWLQEVGPFVLRYSEHKRDYQFTANGEEIHYSTYRRYYVVKELSCDYCDENTPLTLPNAVTLGALNNMEDPKYECSNVCKTLVEIGLLLLGENPFRTVTFDEITFGGYYDPFLTFVHSELYAALCDLFNNGEPLMPFAVPDMEKMAFFIGYNDTNDQEYVMKTGQGNIERIGEVIQWAGARGLPHSWWTTPHARMINGSDCGSFSRPQLTKNDVFPFFLALLCRSFYATYAGETVVNGVPSYKFETPYEAFDTTSNENIGFRYRNAERIDYFEEWDPCPNKKKFDNCSNLPFIDCSRRENFCSECCEGKLVDGTYLLPPGMFPLSCFSGKTDTAPFSAIFSPPHWLYSPPEVVNSVRGLSPSREHHVPFISEREPISGTLTQARVRLMASFPVFRNPHATIVMHVRSMVVPTFWLNIRALLHDSMYEPMRFGFVIMPRAMFIAKIVTLVVSVLLAAIAITCRTKYLLRRHRFTTDESGREYQKSFVNGNVKYL
ncbi:Uncharacterized protein R07B1.3 [Toxocara canis]|uniref:Uncharacterized protein R07B1.3 n=2 Tax=Toxocara canis TaxID=6265 RepID=A0A0B2V6U2_TOXCA|nr:Uncharacterized protein R07B1.3 [Toxocara canis]VDM39533.1 unnamed protein product [Toxocara canis]